MDIMNIMKVSSPKFTFSLIAFAALLVSGSGLMIQETFAANEFDRPEFSCNHINLTATHCTFDQKVNGTLAILDWTIRYQDTAADGDNLTDVTITGIANSTNVGVGLTVPSTGVSNSNGDVELSTVTGIAGLGYINGTDFVLIHSAVNASSTYYVNYTNNPASLTDVLADGSIGRIYSEKAGSSGATLPVGACQVETANCKYLKLGSNATASDWISPTAVSAEILRSNPSQVQITMSEPVVNVNSTWTGFNFTTLGGGNDAVASKLTTYNGTSIIYVDLQHPVQHPMF